MTSHMTRSTRLPAVLAALAVLQGTPASAATKVWVSNSGSNANPCTLALPCATFQHAHDVVAAGGEITILTPGDYGQITINKSISITNGSVGEAGILSTDAVGSAIFILAGLGDVVSLHGLVLDGAGAGLVGLNVNRVGSLHVQNCVIRNFEGGALPHGIFMTANSGTSSLFLSDTIVYNNGSGGSTGGVALISQGTGSLKALLNRVRLENNVIGLRVSSNSGPGNARVTVRDSTAVGNVGDGILAKVDTGAGAVVLVERTTTVNNAGSGLHADGTHAVILLSDSTITKNGTGVSTTSGGQLISYGNNRNNNNVGAEGTATSMLSLF
jgi:hypothetical protein